MMHFKTLFLLLPFFITLYINDLNAQWADAIFDTVSVEDTYVEFNIKSTLAVDEENNLHMVWKTTSFINYARRTKHGEWDEIQKLLINASAGGPIIDINQLTGNPVIVMKQGGVPDYEVITLHYLKNGQWEMLTVSDSSYVSRSPTLKVDDNGNVHLAWVRKYSFDNRKLVYCTVNISDESIFKEELPQGTLGDSWGIPYIGFSKDLGPVISFSATENPDSSDYKVHVAQKAPGSGNWEYELVNVPNPFIVSNSMVVSGNTIHLFISGTASNSSPIEGSAIHYLKKPFESSWSIPEKINDDIPGRLYSNFHVDENEKIHCVWFEMDVPVSPGTFYYSTNKTGSWERTAIVENQNFVLPSMVFNNQSQGFVFARKNFGFPNYGLILYGAQSIINSVKEPVNFNQQVSIYPNPGFSEFFLQNKKHQTFANRLKLFDLNGNLIFEGKIPPGNSIRLNRTRVNSGTYIYQLFEKEKLVGKGKLIIE